MKTIIHIDDDLDDLSLFQKVISKINPLYVVQSFSDSKTAIAFLEESILKPDIIFLDINMPEMNGKETLLLIRRNKNLFKVPVIMYSTTIYGADKKMYLDLGATDFLQKGYGFEGMVEDMDHLLLLHLRYGKNEFYTEQMETLAKRRNSAE